MEPRGKVELNDSQFLALVPVLEAVCAKLGEQLTLINARGLSDAAHGLTIAAMPPGREPYNLDALWARIAVRLERGSAA